MAQRYACCQALLLNPLKERCLLSVICAIFSTSGVSDDEVQTALTSLEAYPHDAKGSWKAGPMALAACTLHTTSESQKQSQPIVTQDEKLACVFDGYLINHQEVAADLEARGVALKNRSDVEIALRAYEEWGEGCADRLEGEFAFIIADLEQGRLFAARDHIGFVPLYFLQDGDRLIIASDFRTIIALTPKSLEPNLRYLAQTITNRWYLPDETPWKQIQRMRRAHHLSFNGQTLSQRQYWSPPTDVTIVYKSLEEYAEHYLEVLTDCVRRASRSHAQIGVAISGGLDSSAIFAVADRLEKDGQWNAPGFHGYSLAAADGTSAFELPYARAAAEHVGRSMSEIPLFDPDIDYYTRDAAWHKDIAIPSNGAMMINLEEQVVADGSRVLLNGAGGDEWLQGVGHCYAEFLDSGDIPGLYRTFRDEAQYRGLRRGAFQGVRQLAVWAAPDLLREPIRRRAREQRRRDDVALTWLAPELRAALREAEEAYEEELPTDPMAWSKVHLVSTARSDLTHTMMRRQRNRIGVESRHPMHYRSFIEFSCSTPAHIKRKGALTKLTHRIAMQDYLPEKVLNRVSKANFANTKIDHQFAEYARAHADESLQNLCDFKGISQIFDVDFRGPEGDYWAWEIWGLYASAAFLYQANRTGDY